MIETGTKFKLYSMQVFLSDDAKFRRVVLCTSIITHTNLFARPMIGNGKQPLKVNLIATAKTLATGASIRFRLHRR